MIALFSATNVILFYKNPIKMIHFSFLNKLPIFVPLIYGPNELCLKIENNLRRLH